MQYLSILAEKRKPEQTGSVYWKSEEVSGFIEEMEQWRRCCDDSLIIMKFQEQGFDELFYY